MIYFVPIYSFDFPSIGRSYIYLSVHPSISLIINKSINLTIQQFINTFLLGTTPPSLPPFRDTHYIAEQHEGRRQAGCDADGDEATEGEGPPEAGVQVSRLVHGHSCDALHGIAEHVAAVASLEEAQKRG